MHLGFFIVGSNYGRVAPSMLIILSWCLIMPIYLSFSRFGRARRLVKLGVCSKSLTHTIWRYFIFILNFSFILLFVFLSRLYRFSKTNLTFSLYLSYISKEAYFLKMYFSYCVAHAMLDGVKSVLSIVMIIYSSKTNDVSTSNKKARYARSMCSD